MFLQERPNLLDRRLQVLGVTAFGGEAARVRGFAADLLSYPRRVELVAAGTVRTARLLLSGQVHVPESVFAD